MFIGHRIVLAGCDIDACILGIAFQLWDAAIDFIVKWDSVYTGESCSTYNEKVRKLYKRNFGV